MERDSHCRSPQSQEMKDGMNELLDEIAFMPASLAVASMTGGGIRRKKAEMRPY